MKLTNSFLLLIILSQVYSCSSKSLIEPQPARNEYIIKAEGQEGFYAINIFTGKSKSIPAVIELEGRMYLPFLSSIPSFNKKVLEGFFIPDTNYYLTLRDTIFRVTKHLRDTTAATVGI
jgi:hypothetical protein